MWYRWKIDAAMNAGKVRFPILSPAGLCPGMPLSRIHAVENGERDRLGRRHWRLANDLGGLRPTLNGGALGRSSWSAGRRSARARRSRSPFLIVSLRLRAGRAAAPMLLLPARAVLKRKGRRLRAGVVAPSCTWSHHYFFARRRRVSPTIENTKMSKRTQT
jgi:hypothetical protein